MLAELSSELRWQMHFRALEHLGAPDVNVDPYHSARGVPWAWLISSPPPRVSVCVLFPQPHLAVGSNDYYISVYSVEKRIR